MGIKVGSVVALLETTDDISEGEYEIIRADPDDLIAPWEGIHIESGETAWFTPDARLYDYEDALTAIVRE